MELNWRYLLLIPALLIFVIYVGEYITVAPVFVTAVFAAIVIALITFQKPEHGLMIIVFSMLLSPEIAIAQLPKRTLAVRVEDILIIVMFLAWLAHTAVDKEWKGFIKTPIDLPLLAFLTIALISSGMGILQGRLVAVKSLFYVLKYFEYFILYWTTANIIPSRKAIPKYLIAGFITCVIVAVYAYSLIGTAPRVSAPFDSEAKSVSGESASLGGYLIIVMSLIAAFFVVGDKKSWWLWGFFALLVPPFVYTLSRASFYALGPAIAAIFLFAPRRKMTLFLIAAAVMILFPLLAPEMYQASTQRLNETFVSAASRHYTFGPISFNLEESAAQRLENWIYCFTDWLPKHPIIGHGVTGVGLVDSQFPLYLGEIGLLGFSVFGLIIFRIYRVSLRVLRRAADRIDQALALGLIGSLTGLLVQSVGVNTFIVIRIMEPFWFLTALVLGVLYSHEYDDEPIREAR